MLTVLPFYFVKMLGFAKERFVDEVDDYFVCLFCKFIAANPVECK
jgi:hypothetical protein